MRRASVVNLLLSVLRPGGEGPPTDAWDLLDYERLRMLLHSEQCELWFYRRTNQIGTLDLLPSDFRDWLCSRARKITATNQLIDAARDRVVTGLTEGGFPHVILKGAARRLLAGEFPLIDARASVDVDVITPGSHCRQAWQFLLAHGYHKSPPKKDHAQKHAPLHFIPVQDDSGVPVEIHHSTQRELDSGVAWSRVESGSRRVVSRSTAVTIPGNTEMFWHGLHHSVHQGAFAFRLRFLLDAVAMLHAPDIDFELVRARIEAGETDNVRIALDWLSTARHLCDGDVASKQGGYDVVRTLDWHLRSMETTAVGRRIARRAAEEGRRVEMGLGPLEAVPGASWPLRIRRKAISALVRGAYRSLA